MSGEAGPLRRQAENEFVPAVLAAMQRRLEQRYGPAAVIQIRRLSFRCALKPSAQGAAALAELLGEDLAAQVEALALRERGTGPLPQPSASVQIYRDGAHRDAAVLIAAAERRAGPAGEKPDFGRTWRALGRSPRSTVAAVLSRCLQARRLDVVLARLAPSELESLAAMVSPAAPPALLRAVRRVLDPHVAVAAGGVGKPQAGPGPRGGSPRQRERPGIEPPDLTSKDEASASPRPRALAPDLGEVSEAESGSAYVQEPPPPTEAVAGRAPAPSPLAQEPPLAHAPAPPPTTDAETRAPPSAGEPGAECAEETGEVVGFASRWCALLYLLNVSQKLEVAERLWQVGASEGDVLAAVLARLAAEEGDPTTGVLSPRFPEPSATVPMFQDWAREELVDGIFAAAVKLTASSAPTEALQARVTALHGWYGRGAANDVVGWLAACLLAVFETLTGGILAPGALAGRFGVRGRIELGAETIRVVMPMESIDLEVRRAGLDADPGWLAWLGRRMVFEFEADAP